MTPAIVRNARIASTAPLEVTGRGWGRWENGPFPVQLDADARARPLLYLGTAGQQEGLDVGPEQTSGTGRLKMASSVLRCRCLTKTC